MTEARTRGGDYGVTEETENRFDLTSVVCNCTGLFDRNSPDVLLQNINKICAQGPGEEKNVQQEQAGQRQGPVEDRVTVLRGHSPYLPLPGT